MAVVFLHPSSVVYLYVLNFYFLFLIFIDLLLIAWIANFNMDPEIRNICLFILFFVDCRGIVLIASLDILNGSPETVNFFTKFDVR